MSLEAFKAWAPYPQNLLVIPGYCVVGTVGSKLVSGFQGKVEVDKNPKNSIDVR